MDASMFTNFQPAEQTLEHVTSYIQCSDMATFKRRKTKQSIRTVLMHWCRSYFVPDESLMNAIYSNVLLYCMQPTTFKLCWSSEHHKSPLIELEYKHKTAIIHQKAFRNPKNNEINFDQLSKSHYVQSSEPIPHRIKHEMVTSVSISFEIYEQFVQHNLDRNECALHGSHKIGIASNVINPKTKKKYFIGLSSTYNQTYHRKTSFLFGSEHTVGNKQQYNYKQDGVLFVMDFDGKKKPVLNGTAFRKFEVITMRIDWMNKELIFKREKQNKCGSDATSGDGDGSLICIPLQSNTTASSKFAVTDVEWYPCVTMCLNQTDSFMWSHDGVQDWIRVTLLPGDIV